MLLPLFYYFITRNDKKNILQVIVFHTTGNLFSYIIGDLLRYRTVLWISLMLPTVHLILCLLMPESPSFLIKRGKENVSTDNLFQWSLSAYLYRTKYRRLRRGWDVVYRSENYSSEISFYKGLYNILRHADFNTMFSIYHSRL